MIHLYSIGKTKILDFGVKSWGSKKPFLVDVYKPSDKELNLLSQKTKIPLDYLHDSLDEDERPRVSDLGNYSHIVYKAPHIKDKKTEVYSFSIFFSNKLIVVLHKHKIDVMEKFPTLTDKYKMNILKNGSSYVVFWLLDHLSDSFFKVMDDIEERVENLESEIFKKPNKKTVKKIFDFKKILIYYHKALASNRDVIASIEKGYLKYINKSGKDLFRDIYHDLAQLVDMGSILRDVLTTNLDIYLGTISNNMNQVMKKLTVYASFVMVPTLITGIYGMNFRLMPELFWRYGYLFALGIMILSVVVMYFFFKKKEWI